MTNFGGNTWTNRPYLERHCIFCGRQFMSKMPSALHCSHACAQRTYRSRAMLAGTHGWVGDQFKRLPSVDNDR